MQNRQNLPPPCSTIGKSINIDWFLSFSVGKQSSWISMVFSLSSASFTILAAQIWSDEMQSKAIIYKYLQKCNIFLQSFGKFAIFLVCIVMHYNTMQYKATVQHCTIYIGEYSSILRNHPHDIVQHWAILHIIVQCCTCTVQNRVLSIMRDQKD